MIRTLLCLLLLSVPAHAETKRSLPRTPLIDPSTLVMTYTFVATGEKGSVVQEYRSLKECEKNIKRWRDADAKDDRRAIVSITCNKWLKIAPADRPG